MPLVCYVCAVYFVLSRYVVNEKFSVIHGTVSYYWYREKVEIACYLRYNIILLEWKSRIFFLDFRYEQQFIGQADEILQKIVFRGNFDKDFKDFLKEKGF